MRTVICPIILYYEYNYICTVVAHFSNSNFVSLLCYNYYTTLLKGQVQLKKVKSQGQTVKIPCRPVPWQNLKIMKDLTKLEHRVLELENFLQLTDDWSVFLKNGELFRIVQVELCHHYQYINSFLQLILKEYHMKLKYWFKSNKIM